MADLVIPQEPASAPVAVVPTSDNPSTTIVTSQGTALTPNATTLNVLGREVNVALVLVVIMFVGFLIMFLRFQLSKRLDFADMITFDGKKVSLSKVLQLVGGAAATWIVIKMAALGTLSSELFGIYLTYVGAIEGWAKFVAAKYGYKENAGQDTSQSDRT